MTIYIASSNVGKLRDFAAASSLLAVEPLPGLHEIAPPDEDQVTFEGNARLKALYYSRHAPKGIVVADDSGLEVDVLHGEPGVRSARYADDHHFASAGTTDERNNRYLLQALAGSVAPYAGRYRCVLAAARDREILCTAHGTVEGEILTTPRGTMGFGYDPLFYLPELGKTMAELDTVSKLAFSHRGRAFKALLEFLQPQLEQNQ